MEDNDDNGKPETSMGAFLPQMSNSNESDSNSNDPFGCSLLEQQEQGEEAGNQQKLSDNNNPTSTTTEVQINTETSMGTFLPQMSNNSNESDSNSNDPFGCSLLEQQPQEHMGESGHHQSSDHNNLMSTSTLEMEIDTEQLQTKDDDSRLMLNGSDSNDIFGGALAMLEQQPQEHRDDESGHQQHSSDHENPTSTTTGMELDTEQLQAKEEDEHMPQNEHDSDEIFGGALIMLEQEPHEHEDESGNQQSEHQPQEPGDASGNQQSSNLDIPTSTTTGMELDTEAAEKILPSLLSSTTTAPPIATTSSKAGQHHTPRSSSLSPPPPKLSSVERELQAKEDARMMRINKFGPIHIPCERLEIVLQRDRKAMEREQLRRERERRAEAAEKRRRERREDSNSTDSKEFGNRKDRKKHRRSPGPLTDKSRLDALSPLKKSFSRLVQCCVCELIVQPARFGGRDSAFCSAECIGKRVELVRKCVREDEHILLMDLKGNMLNGPANPTIDNLEPFINENPRYNPVIDEARLRAATQRELDPAQQKKIEAMRVDVRKAIESALQKRSKTANMNFSLKRYKDLGHEIERALFAIHQDVSVKYRKWFRGFIMVINDEGNAYFKEVLRDKVSPKRLVTLNEDQMQMPISGSSGATTSSAVLAPADSTSVLADKDDSNGGAGSSVPTKGLSDSIAAIAGRVLGAGTSLGRPSMAKKLPITNVIGKTAIDEILGEAEEDTTVLHATHFFDKNCKICKEEQAKKLAQKERQKQQEAKLDEQMKRQPNKPYFPNLDPEIRAAMLDSAGSTGFNSISTSMGPPPSRHRPMLDTHDPLGLNMVKAGDPIIENQPPLSGNFGHSALDYEDEENHDFGGDTFDDDYGEPPPPTHNDFAPNQEEAQFDRREEEQPQPVTTTTKTPPTETVKAASGFGDSGFANAFSTRSNRDEPIKKNTKPISVDRFRTVEPITTTHKPSSIDRFRNVEPIMTTEPSSIDHFQTTPIDSGDSWKKQQQPQDDTVIVGRPSARAGTSEDRVLVEQQQYLEEDLDPWQFECRQVWQGTMVWTKHALMKCTLTAVSSRGVFKAGRELPQVIHLIGRSEADGVWEYIAQLRDSWNKQVCLMVIERPEYRHDYVMYMDYHEKFNRSSQVGVLDFNDHPTIKDGYIFMLNASESLPATLLPVEGAGLPAWTQHYGCIVVMLVRRMDHEDKKWRKRRDESWRSQPSAGAVGALPIPLKAELMQPEEKPSDPRLDPELTTRMGSRLYKVSRLYKRMPLVFNQLISQLKEGDESEN